MQQVSINKLSNVGSDFTDKIDIISDEFVTITRDINESIIGLIEMTRELDISVKNTSLAIKNSTYDLINSNKEISEQNTKNQKKITWLTAMIAIATCLYCGIMLGTISVMKGSNIIQYENVQVMRESNETQKENVKEMKESNEIQREILKLNKAEYFRPIREERKKEIENQRKKKLGVIK